MLGLVFKAVIVDPLIRQGVLPLVISTIALAILLKDGVKDLYSAEAQPFPTLLPDTVVSLLGVNISLAQLGVLAVALATIVALQLVPRRHAHRPADAGDRAEPDGRAHPRRQRRAHDPLHLPHQRRARGHGLAADLADLPRQVLQRRDARPRRLRRGHRRRLQPGARRHRRRPPGRRHRQPGRRLRLDRLSRRPCRLCLLVLIILFRPQGLLGRREERAV